MNNVARLSDLAAIVVMGVSGSGKSTVAEALAGEIGFRFRDADAFHPPANIAKMSAGQPLTDDDRRPWLRAIAAAIDDAARERAPLVISCSALKREYREILLHGRDDVVFAYLKGSRALIAARLATRKSHFMPPALLDSQFAALEEPQADEPVVALAIDRPVPEIVDDLVARLNRGG